MRKLYSLITRLGYALIWCSQFFSKKMRLFVKGRQGVIDTIRKNIKQDDKTIWFHCASLGEFEQGLPIMEAVKNDFPEYKIIVTFFSPSGYEIKKNAKVADLITYLPADTVDNSKKFVAALHPSLAIFVKYEFWPNYLFALDESNVPVILVSGLFREKQSFFKSYGGFMRAALKTMDHLFVQNEASREMLSGIGISNVTVSGDTRFDRVSHQIEQMNTLDFIEDFKGDNLCVVCGSTWPEDESILLPFIKSSIGKIKFVIAPHTMETAKINSLRSKLSGSTALFSERHEVQLQDIDVLIIDTIGLLSKIYSYADIAYVGGAMGNTGLHNILEPATFGIPIIIGRNFAKFPEAKRMQALAALFSVSSSEELSAIMTKLTVDSSFRSKTGMIAGHFVNSNTGATRITMDYIRQLHSDGFI